MSLRRNPHTWLLLALFTGLFAASCSVEKNTAATRNFHNLTSHYNIFFNANESYKQGLERAGESFVDDYTSILPLFYYEDESVQQSVTPQMKTAIDKCTKVITFHSITAKPKIKQGKQSEKDKAFYEKNEYNKWVDDSYLLIGKSYMQQGKFFMAAESFKHVLKTYPGEEAYYLAMAWLVRAYNAIGNLDASEDLIVALKDVDEFPKKHEEVLHTSMADYHMKQEEYEEAADYLVQALETRPKKTQRIRYTYILAQLLNETGNGEASVRNFRKVIRMNPPYVMAFNAKVSMASAFQAGASNSEEIKKLLNKMLKDPKNDEFQDQIYFALANIYMEEGDRGQAIEYYHRSVTSSVQNNYQKGQSCLTLAEIYYNEPRYTLSAAYYDTAVNLLESDYPNYRALQVRSRSLNHLVTNIHTYELQDSVQVLAAMPESARNAKIDAIIDQVRKEEEEARQREQQAMQDMQFNRSAMYQEQASNLSGSGSGQQGGRWYFYNLNAKSFGQPEFRMKWGERKLEDNWRRRNRQTVSDLLEEGGAEGVALTDSAAGMIIDNKSREFYMRDIPLTDSAIAVSDALLEEALYNMGMIYRDDLLDYEKAIESLEELVERYPDGKHTMASYYYLHDLYNSVQQPSRATYYKEQLSRKYPESHMTMLLTNPNYIREMEEAQQKVESFYEDVYNDYRNSRYADVIRKAERGIIEYTEDKDLLVRLSYLKAMATGAVHGKEAMKSELDSIVAWYPDTEIAAEAREIIDYMYVAFPEVKEADQVREAVELYTYDPEAVHLFLLAVKRGRNLNLVNFNLLNYNLDNFNTYNLVIELKNLGVDYNLLHVKEFANNQGVRRYADKVSEDIVKVMGEIPEDEYEIVLISKENYNKLLEAKEFKPYLLFYRQNYVQ
ncbi:MAG: tetratricopeptide repeat protein [Bacteroidales bacterium]|nr:tetratricopeptide repeat protein [Bacteroidales bacterium]MDT8432821.1 tetratricopeptide repeat protein [Bacteroidales bacterium]